MGTASWLEMKVIVCPFSHLTNCWLSLLVVCDGSQQQGAKWLLVTVVLVGKVLSRLAYVRFVASHA